LLDWKFASVILAILISFGVSMAIAESYLLAYVFFVLFGAYLLLFWLSSDVLRKRRRNMQKRDMQRHPDRLAAAARSYCVWEWGGSAIVILLVVACIWITNYDKRQKFHADTFQNLTVEHFIPNGAEDDPMNTFFTVTNHGTHKISKHHGIFCYTKFAVGVDGTSFEAGIESTRDENGNKRVIGGPHLDRIDASSILDRGGDAESNDCLSWFHFKPSTYCADVAVIFWYSLEDYPDIEVQKFFRFKAIKGADKFNWIGVPMNSKEPFCLDTFKGDKKKLPDWLISGWNT